MRWPWTKKPHIHNYEYDSGSWGRETGATLLWSDCACGDFVVTYRKPGPGWWVEANEKQISLMRRIADRRMARP